MALGGMAKIEKEAEIKVRWIPWEGRPEGVPFLESTPEEAEQRLAKHRVLAGKYGMTLIFPQNKCRTRRAHQATLFARDQGRMEAYRNAVYSARFHEDKNIADPEVLISLGEKIGLDGQALREALEGETYAAGLDGLREQGISLGVDGTPTYIVDRQKFHGVDETEAILETLKKRQ
ncbi:MAG: DsbA family protein [Nitrospinota bacterium]